MTVLVDATALASGHKWRGIGTYVRHLVVGMAGRAPDATAFLTLGDDEHLPHAIPLLKAPPTRWPDLWPLYGGRLRRLLRDGGYSIYHFTSPEASIAAPGVKIIGTVYDLIPLERSNAITLDPRQVWRGALYGRYLRHLRRADHLIAISATTARDISEKLHISADRVTTIPLGIDHGEYQHRAEQGAAKLRAEHALPETFWLAVTSPNPNKGWPDLVRALARTRDAGYRQPLVIAGYWLTPQRDRLLALASQLGVQDLVVFVGYVPDDTLPALYAAAFGFLFASHREGFGLPVLEAMTLGTPVIVSDDAALQELTAGAALSFPRGSSDALAERMLELARNPELRATLAKAGERRSADYSWGETVRRTLALYEAL